MIFNFLYHTYCCKVATVLEIRGKSEKLKRAIVVREKSGNLRKSGKVREKSGNLNRLSESESFTIP